MACVYVFPSGGENLYRIGRTRGDVGKRRQDLSPGNPHPLKTFRVIETGHDSLVENFLHKKFVDRLSRCGDRPENKQPQGRTPGRYHQAIQVSFRKCRKTP